MRTYKLFLWACTIASASLIANACSGTTKAYTAKGRYWQGHKHTSHYERWR